MIDKFDETTAKFMYDKRENKDYYISSDDEDNEGDINVISNNNISNKKKKVDEYQDVNNDMEEDQQYHNSVEQASLSSNNNNKKLSDESSGKNKLSDKEEDVRKTKTAKFIAELASMIDQNQISHIVISQKLFPELAKENISPMKIAKKNGWLQEDDTQLIEKYISDVMVEYPDKVEAYKNGKTNLIGLFMGERMKKTKGKFNPKLINKLLQTKLMK